MAAQLAAERVSRLPLASPSAFLQGQETVPDFQVSLGLTRIQHQSINEAIENREDARAEALAREHVQGIMRRRWAMN